MSNFGGLANLVLLLLKIDWSGMLGIFVGRPASLLPSGTFGLCSTSTHVDDGDVLLRGVRCLRRYDYQRFDPREESKKSAGLQYRGITVSG